MNTSTSTIRRAPIVLTANAGHAGIYIGNGLMIHAMNPVDGTKVTAVMPGMGYYRLLG